jgi:hypothetical protein
MLEEVGRNIGKYAGGGREDYREVCWRRKGNSLKIWRELIHGTSFHSFIALFI